MTKKINFDSTVKKVENISNTVDLIMRNKLIIALFLIVDGVTFIFNPNTTLPEMARNIILLIILAAFSVLISNLSTKTKDVKTIVLSAIIIIAGIVMYIYPDFISAYIQLLLALFIIFDGAKNIVNALHLDKINDYAQSVVTKYNKLTKRKTESEKTLSKKEKFKEVDKNINDGLEEQKEKLITPLKNMVDKTSKFVGLYVAANVATMMLGVILLVFPDVSMMIWGIIFLYTGLSNLVVSIRTMDLTRKIKKRRNGRDLGGNTEEYV